ncbi:2-oxo acid dehydrogenase subunit E2 [Conexibacter sp. DBS9H8]|uniref:2-oxo acid dehydrogenase subunit E2 n=1 Tax=Conexibacter sp. DBS9H8 TaxID=2937801 RepID=UPI002010594C|nr:2-oxo acid dehydrogenase subunit E2 [Conexibacter sp. DBS9H8]
MSDLIEVTVPDIGDFSDVPVIEILVAEGDRVAADDPLLTLESDKATMDIPAPAAGTVARIAVGLEDRVSEGALLLELAPTESAAASPADGLGEAEAPLGSAAGAHLEAETESVAPPAPSAPAPSSSAPAAPPSPPAAPAPPSGSATGASAPAGVIYASPSARRLARESGVDIGALGGSGRLGRITVDDVRAAAQAAAAAPAGRLGGLELAPWPTVDFSRFGPTERVPRTRIQKISAPNLARNWVMIPHVTQHDHVDITDLEAWRVQLNAEQREVKFTMVSFLIRAAVATLRRFPDFNASLDGDDLVHKHYYNIGFAADTPNGLVVPVIKDADTKGLAAIARELATVSARAREGKLAPADISGSTFSISSLGGIGGSFFTPIINAPEVAILGVSRASLAPVWDGTAFVPRLLLPLSLSYDHRVIDGAAAARFIVALGEVLADLRRALL